MQVRILFFATLKDLTKRREMDLHFPTTTTTVAIIRAELCKLFPDATANLNIALCAVNEEYAFNPETVEDGAEVAFFPPVSGGSALPEVLQLATEPIDHDELIRAISTEQTGAVVVFSGLVRGETQRDGHLPTTEFLEYEAYEQMALAKMKQVAKEIREQWDGVIGIAIVQRLGRLVVKDNTILIACSSAHRDSGCFEAARYGIDRLKEIVPVWKKEVSTQGETWVEGAYIPQQSDKA